MFNVDTIKAVNVMALEVHSFSENKEKFKQVHKQYYEKFNTWLYPGMTNLDYDEIIDVMVKSEKESIKLCIQRSPEEWLRKLIENAVKLNRFEGGMDEAFHIKIYDWFIDKELYCLDSDELWIVIYSLCSDVRKYKGLEGWDGLDYKQMLNKAMNGSYKWLPYSLYELHELYQRVNGGEKISYIDNILDRIFDDLNHYIDYTCDYFSSGIINIIAHDYYNMINRLHDDIL